MPIRSNQTDRPCTFSIGGVTFEGRQDDVQPTLPTPLDTTTQADTYRAANTSKVISVDTYIGIKYGQAPIGDLRFKPCAPYVYPNGTHQVYTLSSPPHQTASFERDNDGRPDRRASDVGVLDWPGLGVRKSEDCLFLNIYRPSATPPTGGWPVVFYIRGGGWVINYALSDQFYGGRLAANGGVMVVTIDYRHSIFGNLPHPDLIEDGEPTVAYTDMKVALEWVHDNIANAGGDPDRVLIAGSSAGGAAVLALLEDDEAQGWFSYAWADGGGGTAPYLDEDFYIPRALAFERMVRVSAGFMTSADPQYRTVQDAFDDGRSFAWVAQNALRVEHIQSFSDIGPTVTAASVKEAIAGTGPLVASFRAASQNVYPFRRNTAINAIEAAKAGKFRKPTVLMYAECEAVGIVASNNVNAMRDAMNALGIGNLNGLAQRLGFADFAAYKAQWATILTPFGYTDLKELPTALLTEAVDPGGDAETRRVLYTQSVFGYAAWRQARAMFETGSAPAYLVLNNFSPNSFWAGHTSSIPLTLGNPEWEVGAGSDFPSATPPGQYAAIYMDTLYMAEIYQRKISRMAATGDPDGAYDYDGFDLFDGNPPADGGSLTGAWSTYNTTEGGHHNVMGKYSGAIDNLNGANGVLTSQRDAKTTYAGYMGQIYTAARLLLEP